MGIWEIWADTGGTFTDCISKSPEGEIKRTKVLSSGMLKGEVHGVSGKTLKVALSWPLQPDIFCGYTFSVNAIGFESKVLSSNLAQGEITLNNQLPDDAFFPLSFDLSAHEEPPVLGARILTETALDDEFPPLELKLGSTKGTNALLELKGEKPLLIVTKGFKDLLKIHNQQRPDLFSLNINKPEKLFSAVIEVDERIAASGELVNPLTQGVLDEVVSEVIASNAKSVAICLLNSYKNAEHEKLLLDALHHKGISNVSASHQIAPSIKYVTRTETVVVNAYLQYIIDQYLANIEQSLAGSKVKVMSSAGSLKPIHAFWAKDSLMSGPAGGIIGASIIGNKVDEPKILTLDMGGTSTDVGHYNAALDYAYEVQVGPAKIASPSLKLETVAAGGGSICGYDGIKLFVGPESAGANPGPACYGAGGPLTITDVNLLLGRLNTREFGIPIYKSDAQQQLDKIAQETGIDHYKLLQGFLDIANEKMAAAVETISVNQGYDPKDYALLGFGGAGGLHFCEVASLLGMHKAILPFDAGILSAYGIGNARIEKDSSAQVLLPLQKGEETTISLIQILADKLLAAFISEGYDLNDIEIDEPRYFLRFQGQDQKIEIQTDDFGQLEELFEQKYRLLFGHWVEGLDIELESVRVNVGTKQRHVSSDQSVIIEKQKPVVSTYQTTVIEGNEQEVPVYSISDQKVGTEINGPCILTNKTSTAFIPAFWSGRFYPGLDLVLNKLNAETTESITKDKLIELELYTNRFKLIADKMGGVLEKTAFSVNVKDRLDYSCALLDAKGNLIVNAPHIPVHLGALGYCVKNLIELFDFKDGDVIITNHPGYGGSHLPDVTLIAPVFFERELVGFVANRAHHSEIGGKLPGSMPPNAKNLAEEGVVITPQYLVKQGHARWDAIEELLTKDQYPTRGLRENISDLKAGIASLEIGKTELIALCDKFSSEKVSFYFEEIYNQAALYLDRALSKLKDSSFSAVESLDDGHEIHIQAEKKKELLTISFVGTSAVHPGNLNATPAIVHSAVLYVLRLLVDENLPLNDGLLKNVKIELPECFLNPVFATSPTDCPAVVGGNTETSQRVVDTLIKAFGLAACSQGTMNNLLFGNEHFGYYETIGGGSGAGNGFDGADAVHQHMTNTRITDPEILELRYPVRLIDFSIRRGSGGLGEFRGGDGIRREIEFLNEVDLTVLTQHRIEQPYGLNGGGNGAVGKQILIRKDGNELALKGVDTKYLVEGDRVVILTPGGGAYGKKK